MTPIRVFNRTAHNALWAWLAENPGCIKDDWPGWDELGLSDEQKSTMHEHFNCFACLTAGYCKTARLGTDVCCTCPIQWYGEDCFDDGRLFGIYSDAQEDENYELATHVALAIANLPVRKFKNFITIVI